MSEENDRAICCTCKNDLELVRPGKHQCNVCEDRPILRHNGVGEADMYSDEELKAELYSENKETPQPPPPCH